MSFLYIYIYMHSLWILRAATGLSCEEKYKNQPKKKKEKNMVSHFPVFVRASNSLCVVRAEVGNLAMSRVSWEKRLPLNTVLLWVVVLSEAERSFILDSAFGLKRSKSFPLQWMNEMALGRKYVWVPKNKCNYCPYGWKLYCILYFCINVKKTYKRYE